MGKHLINIDEENINSLLISLGLTKKFTRNRVANNIKTYPLSVQKKIVRYLREGKMSYGEISEGSVYKATKEYRKYEIEDCMLYDEKLIRVIKD